MKNQVNYHKMCICNILIIENDYIDNWEIGLLLQVNGYCVRQIELKDFDRNEFYADFPDLVIIDANILKNETGREIMSELKPGPPFHGVPVLVMINTEVIECNDHDIKTINTIAGSQNRESKLKIIFLKDLNTRENYLYYVSPEENIRYRVEDFINQPIDINLLLNEISKYSLMT